MWLSCKIQLLLAASLALSSLVAATSGYSDETSRGSQSTRLLKIQTRPTARIFSPVVTSITSISNEVLTGVCSGITSIVSLVEVAVRAILVASISIVDALSSTLAALFPQTAVPIAAVQSVLTVANQTLSNVTGLVSTFGCTLTTGVDSFINSLGAIIINI